LAAAVVILASLATSARMDAGLEVPRLAGRLTTPSRSRYWRALPRCWGPIWWRDFAVRRAAMVVYPYRLQVTIG
jgi:hypothetical protein